MLLKEARGEYLIFLDGDDFWYSEKMLFEVQEAIRVRNADMVAWWLKTLDNETEVSKENRNFIKEYKECPTGKRFLKDMLSEGRNCWWSWLYAFHRSLWENCDTVFKPGRIICEDEEVLYRIFLQAQRVWVIGKYYYAYRTKRGDSATGILSVQGICSRLEVAEGNIRYLQESETVEEELKRALIRNFSFTWMNIGENIYRLEESRRECIRLLKNKKWMVHNLWGYGAVKIRMKTILIYICGVKLGLWILWIWGKWKRKTLQGKRKYDYQLLYLCTM